MRKSKFLTRRTFNQTPTHKNSSFHHPLCQSLLRHPLAEQKTKTATTNSGSPKSRRNQPTSRVNPRRPASSAHILCTERESSRSAELASSRVQRAACIKHTAHAYIHAKHKPRRNEAAGLIPSAARKLWTSLLAQPRRGRAGSIFSSHLISRPIVAANSAASSLSLSRRPMWVSYFACTPQFCASAESALERVCLRAMGHCMMMRAFDWIYYL